MEDKITLDQVEAAMEGITEKYNSEFYPFEVRHERWRLAVPDEKRLS